MMRTRASRPGGRLPGQRSTGSPLFRPRRSLFGRGQTHAGDDRFSLVFVCSGNRFRSPLAAALVRQVTRGLPVDVTSAGTLDLDGAPALVEAYTVSAGWAVDLCGHRSRVLTPGGVAAADLILGFEQTHVRHAVVDGAAAQSRAFTLAEFVGLLGDVPEPAAGSTVVERARRRVAVAHEARGGVLGPLNTDELADPFGRKRKVYRAVGDELRRLSFALAEGLFEVDPALSIPVVERPGLG